MATHLTVNVKLRIDEELWRALEKLARERDRSTAAEMRRALRKHVAETEAAMSA